MTRLEVISAGPATSVQDRGRIGVQRFGLPPGGAMDREALACANVLLGNAPFAPAIEIGPFGAEFAASGGPVRLAIAGAMRPTTVGETAFAGARSILLAEGDRLRIGPAREGVFSYVAVEGGIAGEPTFGSLAVNARAGLGSPFPRPLAAGDHFDLRPPRPDPIERRIDLPARSSGVIRVVLGPQADEFPDEMIALLQEARWTVSAASDRMGYRLEGPQLVHTGGHNIVSDGTVAGSIQVPGSGQPIVLLADRGTTGGYPKIATVISADLGALAQTPVGGSFQFRAVSLDQAQAAARAAAAQIASLPALLRDADSAFDLAALVSANLAGAAVNAIDARTWQASNPDQPIEQEQP